MIVMPTAKYTALGMPSVRPSAISAIRSVVDRGIPSETANTTAVSRVLVPSVATIGLSPRTATSTPLAIPAARTTTRANSTAPSSRSVWPWAVCVVMTTTTETAPATDRSMPACWMTSVWPRATIARTEANGSMPSRAPRLTLLDANTALHTNSRTLAAVIVVKPRDAPSIERNRLWPVIVPPATVATVDL